MLAATPPAGGGSAATPGAAAVGNAAGNAGGASGAAPSSPSAFFAQNSVNFARPSEADGGWVNWFKTSDNPPADLRDPKSKVSVRYLCYEVQPTRDASIPFVLTRVGGFSDAVPGTANKFKCYAPDPKKPDPLLHGDRLRVAIDLSSDTAQGFFKNVSVLNLSVGLQIAPPLTPALLRTNLGGTATTTGLGSTASVDAEDIGSFKKLALCQALSVSSSCETTVVSGPVSTAPLTDSNVESILKSKFQAQINFQLKTIGNAFAALRDAKAISAPQAALVILPWPYELPGDVLPTLTITALYTTPNDGYPWSGDMLYPAGSIVACPGESKCVALSPGGAPTNSGSFEPVWADPVTTVPDNEVTWQTITADVLLQRAPTYAADGTPSYVVGDHIVWTPQGQAPVESTIEPWRPGRAFLVNQSVVLVDAHGSQKLYSPAKLRGPGITGNVQPQWGGPLISENGSPLQWQAADPRSVTLPELGRQRWRANVPYKSGDSIRCESASQKGNLCQASVGGYSGRNEPWWPQTSTPTGTPGSAPASNATASATTPLRDNQVLWSPFTPTSALAAANQTAPLITEELTQVHSPSMWGLSTAVLATFTRVPSSYDFAKVQPGACGLVSTTTNGVTSVSDSCPPYITNRQRAGDIALLISPYIFHYWYHLHDPSAPAGIDTESRWSFRGRDIAPEPFVGFGLTSPGNSYYVGLSSEVLVRNFQLIAGYGWIKGQGITTPVTAGGGTGTSPPPAAATPNTFTAYVGTAFIGFAYNIAGLITGH